MVNKDEYILSVCIFVTAAKMQATQRRVLICIVNAPYTTFVKLRRYSDIWNYRKYFAIT